MKRLKTITFLLFLTLASLSLACYYGLYRAHLTEEWHLAEEWFIFTLTGLVFALIAVSSAAISYWLINTKRRT